VPLWIAGSVLALVAVAAFFGVRLDRAKARVDASHIRSIAVLPFHAISTEPAYLGLGLADALINRLGTLPQISVRRPMPSANSRALRWTR